MPFLMQYSEPSKRSSIIDDTHENLLVLKDGIVDELEYKKRMLDEIKALMVDESQEEERATEINEHQQDILTFEKKLIETDQRIERLEKMKEHTFGVCFVIRSGTQRAELKELMGLITEKFKNNPQHFDPLLTSIYEKLESGKESLSDIQPEIREDILIPILETEARACVVLINTLFKYEIEYVNANAVGKYALFLNALELNEGHQLDFFIQGVIGDRHFMTQPDGLEKLQNIYQAVFQGISREHISKEEVELFSKLKAEINGLIKQNKLPIDGYLFNRSITSIVSSMEPEVKTLPMSFVSKKITNELFKIIQAPPPFKIAALPSQISEQFKTMKAKFDLSKTPEDSDDEVVIDFRQDEP